MELGDLANNPMDFMSRGICAHETEKWKIFHGGPAFLYEEEWKWPKTHVSRQPRPPETAFIFATSSVVEASVPEEDVVYNMAQQRGDWSSKLHLVAVLRRVILRWRAILKAKTRAAKNALPCVVTLKQEDLAAAEVVLIAAIQKKTFSEEIGELLESGK